jgi:ATP-dependent RNA helicase DDX47/RRP3
VDNAGDGDENATFASLGVVPILCEAIAACGWAKPTNIQRMSIPESLSGRDVVGLAETGSGKTGAFAIPILQALLANPARLFAVVLAPTRELAFQINEVFEALGSSISLHSVCIVGGIDLMTQAIALAKKPHVIVATPGRLVDHLQNTKGFSLRSLKFLVMDEADRMLSMDFEEEINKILSCLPTDRRTMLFSATMTSKVVKLQKASLVNPVKIEINTKFQTPKQLIQQYVFIPAKWKDVYLAYTLDEFKGQSVIIFVATCNNAQRITLMLRNLGFHASCLHGQLSQAKRLGALNKFKAGQRNILVATDVASRGLDIPAVDLVLNVDIPGNGKDYVHRVGRTARAGKAGRSIAYVTQYDVEAYQRLEALLNQKLPEYPADEETVLVLLERVSEAQRLAAREMRELAAQDPKNRKKQKRSSDDAEGGGGGGGGGGRAQQFEPSAMHNQRGGDKSRRKNKK